MVPGTMAAVEGERYTAAGTASNGRADRGGVLLLAVGGRRAPTLARFVEAFIQKSDDRRRLGDADLACDAVDAREQVGRNLEVDQARFGGVERVLVEMGEAEIGEGNVGSFAGLLHGTELLSVGTGLCGDAKGTGTPKPANWQHFRRVVAGIPECGTGAKPLSFRLTNRIDHKRLRR